MNTPKKKPGNRRPGSVPIVAVLVVTSMLVIAAFAFMAVGGSQNGGPNASRAQAKQATNPQDPAVQKTLAALQVKIDSCESLKSKRETIENDIPTQLDTLETYAGKVLSAADKATFDQKKVDVTGKLQKLAGEIKNCSSNMPPSIDIAGTWNAVRTGIQSMVSLVEATETGQPGTAAGTVAFARLIFENSKAVRDDHLFMNPNLNRFQVSRVAKDITDPQALYTALEQNGLMLQGSDCSGFVSYVLIANRLLSTRLATAGFALKAGNMEDNYKIIKDFSPDSPVTEASLKAALSDGTIKPGDLVIQNMTSSYGRSGRGGELASHALLVVGTAYDSPEQGLLNMASSLGYRTWKRDLYNLSAGTRNGLHAFIVRPPYKEP